MKKKDPLRALPLVKEGRISMINHGLLPMKRQWTYGPTLLLWRSHLHTALCLF